MPVLQGGKPDYHCCFRAARSATGISFRSPTNVCELNFVGKGICVPQRRKTAENTHKGYQMPQKKAVLLKNCFVTLNSKNDNSINCQKAPESSVQRAFISCPADKTKAKLLPDGSFLSLYSAIIYKLKILPMQMSLQ